MVNFSVPEEATRQSPGFRLPMIILYVAANCAVGVASIALNTVVLPQQVANITVSTNHTTLFAMTVGFGALASAIAHPLIGILIDRSGALRISSRWLATGTLLVALGFAIMFSSSVWWHLICGSFLSQFGVGVIQAALGVIIPSTPRGQRAVISGAAGIGSVVGGVVGQVVVTRLALPDRWAYAALFGVVILLLACFIAFWKHPKELQKREEEMSSDTINNFWQRAFVCTWISRFALFVCYTGFVNFMSYFLENAVGIKGAELQKAVQVFFLTSVVLLVTSAFVTGQISDHLGRRKPFVLLSSSIMGGALIFLAFLPTWPTVLIGAGIFGCGMGCYLATDLALVTQFLSKNSMRDLGVMNAAIFMAVVVSPALGGLILSQHTITTFFVVSASFAVISALIMIPVETR